MYWLIGVLAVLAAGLLLKLAEFATRDHPHDHAWAVTGAQPAAGAATVVGGPATVVLYRCGCGEHEGRLLPGRWALADGELVDARLAVSPS